MKSPDFKFLPCIFCSIGFNLYVVLRRIIDPMVRYFSSTAITQEDLPQPHRDAESESESL